MGAGASTNGEQIEADPNYVANSQIGEPGSPRARKVVESKASSSGTQSRSSVAYASKANMSKITKNSEERVVTVSKLGFSTPEMMVSEGQSVIFIWEEEDDSLEVVQVIHDGEKLRPVIGGFSGSYSINKGQYEQFFGLEGEYKFAIAGIRSTPLAVTVKRSKDLPAEITDDGFIPDVIDIEEGQSIRWQWNNCSVPHSVQELKFCQDKAGFKKEADSSGKAVRTVTGHDRKEFTRPGLYFFATESAELGKMHYCAVRVTEIAREYRVEVGDRSFNPMILLIEEGDRVWWSWDKNKCKKFHSVYQIEAPSMNHGDEDPYVPVKDGFRWSAPSKQGLLSYEFFKPGVYYYSDQNFQEAAEYIGTIIVKPKQKEQYIELTQEGFQTDLVYAQTGDRIWWTWDAKASISQNQLFTINEVDECLNPTFKKSVTGQEKETYQHLDDESLKVCTKVGMATTHFTTIGVYHYRVSGAPESMNTCSVIVNPGSKNHTIHITDNGFEPKVITVRPNDRVWWVWQSGKKQQNVIQVSHQGATIDKGFCSGMLRDAPSAFTHQFITPGVFYYNSISLPKIFGAIVVSTQPHVHEVQVSSAEIKPDPVTIKQNDIVCWIFKTPRQYDVVEVETVDQVMSGEYQSSNEFPPRRCISKAITRTGVIHYFSKSFSSQKAKEENFINDVRLSSVISDERYDNAVVRVDKSGFYPSILYIQKGQSLLWTWKGSTDAHNIIHVKSPDSDEPMNVVQGAKAFNSGKPVPGNSFLYTFDEDGNYTVASQGAPGFSCTVVCMDVAVRVKDVFISSDIKSGTVDRFSRIDLATETPGAKIYYTTDGSPAELHNDSLKVYDPEKGVILRNSGLAFVRAVAVKEGRMQSHIFTSRRFFVHGDGEDSVSSSSRGPPVEQKGRASAKAWEWWDCIPTIKACFTDPGTLEVFWDPPERPLIDLVRGYQLFLNGVTYCDMFPATNNSLNISGLAGGRMYDVCVVVYSTRQEYGPQKSNVLKMKCPLTVPGGGPVISLERNEKEDALSIVWMSIDSPAQPISGYLVFLNDQQCGKRLVPDPESNRCKVVIGSCDLNKPYKIHVLALPKDSDKVLMSNILQIVLPLDTSRIQLPPKAELLDEEELYCEYLEVHQGSGYLPAMDQGRRGPDDIVEVEKSKFRDVQEQSKEDNQSRSHEEMGTEFTGSKPNVNRLRDYQSAHQKEVRRESHISTSLSLTDQQRPKLSDNSFSMKAAASTAHVSGTSILGKYDLEQQRPKRNLSFKTVAKVVWSYIKQENTFKFLMGPMKSKKPFKLDWKKIRAYVENKKAFAEPESKTREFSMKAPSFSGPSNLPSSGHAISARPSRTADQLRKTVEPSRLGGFLKRVLAHEAVKGENEGNTEARDERKPSRTSAEYEMECERERARHLPPCDPCYRDPKRICDQNYTYDEKFSPDMEPNRRKSEIYEDHYRRGRQYYPSGRHKGPPRRGGSWEDQWEDIDERDNTMGKRWESPPEEYDRYYSQHMHSPGRYKRGRSYGSIEDSYFRHPDSSPEEYSRNMNHSWSPSPPNSHGNDLDPDYQGDQYQDQPSYRRAKRDYSPEYYQSPKPPMGHRFRRSRFTRDRPWLPDTRPFEASPPEQHRKKHSQLPDQSLLESMAVFAHTFGGTHEVKRIEMAEDQSVMTDDNEKSTQTKRGRPNDFVPPSLRDKGVTGYHSKPSTSTSETTGDISSENETSDAEVVPSSNRSLVIMDASKSQIVGPGRVGKEKEAKTPRTPKSFRSEELRQYKAHLVEMDQDRTLSESVQLHKSPSDGDAYREHGRKRKYASMAIIEVQETVELDTTKDEHGGESNERHVAVPAAGMGTRKQINEGEFVQSQGENMLPAVSISVTSHGKTSCRVEWELPEKPDPSYRLLLYVVNVVGVKFSRDVNSDLSFECNLYEEGRPIRGVQHCWNMTEQKSKCKVDGLLPGLTYRIYVITNYSLAHGQQACEVQTSSSVLYYTPVGPPRAPKLKVVSVDMYSALLDWESQQIKEDLLMGYQIYVDDKQLGKVRHKDVHQMLINKMEPGRTLSVHVKAVIKSSMQESEPSNKILVTCPRRPPLVHVSQQPAFKQGCVLIAWEKPKGHTTSCGDEDISSYAIYVDGKLYGDEKANKYGDKHGYQYILNDLSPEQSYDITVKAIAGKKRFHSMEAQHVFCLCESLMSNVLPVMAPAAPKSPKLRLEGLHPEGIDVTWAHPQQHGDAAISGYQMLRDGKVYGGIVPPDVNFFRIRDIYLGDKIKLQLMALTEHPVGRSQEMVMDKEKGTVEPSDRNDDHLFITNLRPATTYTIVVEARRTEKYQDFDESANENYGKETVSAFILTAKSEQLTVKTARPPDPPSNLGVLTSTCSGILLAWDSPREHGVEIIGIRIDAVALNSHDPHHVSLTVLPDATQAKIEGLKEKTDYMVRVTAVTDEYFDKLPDSNRIKFTRELPKDVMIASDTSPWLPNNSIPIKTSGTEPPASLKVSKAATTSLTIRWTPPIVYGTNKLKDLVVRWSDIRQLKKKDNDDLVVASYINLLPTDDTYTIEDLVPGNQYRIIVEAVVSVKTSLQLDSSDSEYEKYRRTAHIMSKPLLTRTRAPTEPPVLLITQYTQDTCQLYWEKPLLMTVVGKDDEGKPKYLRRYLEGYRLDINGKIYRYLAPSSQTCQLTKCKPGRKYSIVLVALTCTEDGKKERKRKYKGFYKNTNPQDLDYEYLLSDDDNLDSSPSEPLEVVLPQNQDGYLHSLSSFFTHNEDRDNRTFGDIKVQWTTQGQHNLLKQFNVVWYNLEDRVVQTKYVSPDFSKCSIPVTKLKTVYNIQVEPIYYTETLAQAPQNIQIMIPGPPDAPEIFLHSSTPEEFVIEWGEPRLYGEVKTRGYQVYLNDKKAGKELTHTHRKAVIPCKPNRTYKVNLVAVSANREYSDSSRSNTLLNNTSLHSPRAGAAEDWSQLDDQEIPVKVVKVTETSVHLDWSSFMETEGIGCYKVQWSSVAQPAEREVKLSNKDNNCVITKCLPGTTHFVRLVVIDKDGNVRERSKQLTIQTSAPPDAPSLSVRACNFRYIAVQWEKPMTYGDALISGYKVYVNGIVEAILNADQQTYTFTHGKWCQEYSFQVQALTAIENLNSKPSDPLVVVWPGVKPPNIRRLPTFTSSSLRVGWDDPYITEGVKVKHYRVVCSEEDTEKIVQSIAPVHPDTREVEFKSIKPGNYNIFLEIHLYGTSEVICSDPISLQPAPAPDPPRVTATVVGLEERRQLEKITCDLVNKRDRLIRQVGHKLKQIGALTHPLKAEKDKDVIEAAHTLTRIEELLEECFSALDSFTGQLIAHVSWQCQQSNPDLQLSGFKVLIDGKQYGSPLHDGVRTVRIKLGTEQPMHRLTLVSMTDKPAAVSEESNAVELLTENFRPFSFYCYHSIHKKDTPWPEKGCCKYQDSVEYERQLGKKLANQGLLKKQVPPPACSLLDIFDGEYKPLLATHKRQYPSAILFWSPWCLPSQKLIGYFSRFAREAAKEYNFIAIACNYNAMSASKRKDLIHMITQNNWREDGALWHCTSQCASSIYEATNNIWKNTPSGKKNIGDPEGEGELDLTELLGIAGVPTLLFIHPEGHIAWHGRYCPFDYASFTEFMRFTFSEVVGAPIPVHNAFHNDLIIDEDVIEIIMQFANSSNPFKSTIKIPDFRPLSPKEEEVNDRIFLKRRQSPKPKTRKGKLTVNQRPYSAHSTTYAYLLKSPYMQKVIPSPKVNRVLMRPASGKNIRMAYETLW
ncbi:hypothetical protein ACJMK2_016773 [Sinanodonta woodiana]|uniref:Fibronectin type-III domain-containing protein n=1 Tax=Sinanodonta woodiana TaxID=1069815 RepID=A0ABD3UWT7_SINWO